MISVLDVVKEGNKGKLRKRQRENTRSKPNKQKSDQDIVEDSNTVTDEQVDNNEAVEQDVKDESAPSPKRVKQQSSNDNVDDQGDNDVTAEHKEE